TEHGIAMGGHAPRVLFAREGYGAFPSELSTQHQVALFNPEEERIAQGCALSWLFMENAAAAIEKANGRIDLLPLTINRTFNDFCRDCQADSSGAWRRQDVLRGGLPHLAKQRELFLLCPYEAVEVPLCVF